GGSVDLTASTTASLIAAGDIPASAALARLLQEGLPAARITMSSDGHASLPHFDASGELISIDVAPLSSLHAALVEAVQAHGVPLATALQTVTQTPAALWGLRDKGQIRVGASADLLVFDPDTLEVTMTFAGGRHYPY
ncbi:MAG: amidohydrolase family protein, partial [Pseudomonadota bacterium]|nr:amidohydrolase family protein [Pseudomonadota bacterium]MDQ3160583.1 amidohydrolase family protein [Pseudomonadota bacterium]